MTVKFNIPKMEIISVRIIVAIEKHDDDDENES